MPREIEDALSKGHKEAGRRADGVSIDPKNYALVKLSKEAEKRLLSAPVSVSAGLTPVQDPTTGGFFFMPDYDRIDGGAPLG